MNPNSKRLTLIANLCNIAGVVLILGCVAMAVLGIVEENTMSAVVGILAALVSALPWFALAGVINALIRIEARVTNAPIAMDGNSQPTVSNSALTEWRAQNPGRSINEYYAEVNKH